MEVLHIVTTLLLVVLFVDSRLKTSKITAIWARLKDTTAALVRRVPPPAA